MKPRDRIYALLIRTQHPITGAEIGGICGLGSWRLYPALAALERAGAIESAWDSNDPVNGYRRRMYWIRKRP